MDYNKETKEIAKKHFLKGLLGNSKELKSLGVKELKTHVSKMLQDVFEDTSSQYSEEATMLVAEEFSMEAFCIAIRSLERKESIGSFENLGISERCLLLEKFVQTVPKGFKIMPSAEISASFVNMADYKANKESVRGLCFLEEIGSVNKISVIVNPYLPADCICVIPESFFDFEVSIDETLSKPEMIAFKAEVFFNEKGYMTFINKVDAFDIYSSAESETSFETEI